MHHYLMPTTVNNVHSPTPKTKTCCLLLFGFKNQEIYLKLLFHCFQYQTSFFKILAFHQWIQIDLFSCELVPSIMPADSKAILSALK